MKWKNLTKRVSLHMNIIVRELTLDKVLRVLISLLRSIREEIFYVIGRNVSQNRTLLQQMDESRKVVIRLSYPTKLLLRPIALNTKTILPLKIRLLRPLTKMTTRPRQIKSLVRQHILDVEITQVYQQMLLYGTLRMILFMTSMISLRDRLIVQIRIFLDRLRRLRTQTLKFYRDDGPPTR